ncbi:MAG TPA: c-type cytochrome [Prolixibacteraceae bacterium]|nr:c-type cytochrome [Prolixibacteraceae bacterium]
MQTFRIAVFSIIILFTSCVFGGGKQKKRKTILKEGAALYTKYGCMVCHSLDGKVVYGPPLDKIFMKEIKVIRNGDTLTVVANREYLKKSITEPRFEKVLEYQNKEMPLTSFSEEETELLVEYIILLNGVSNTEE